MLSASYFGACGDDTDGADSKPDAAAPDSDAGSKPEQKQAADAGRAADGGERSERPDSAAPPVETSNDDEADAGKKQAAVRDDTRRKVSIRFQAKLGKADFACGHKYPSQGTANTTVTPRDFRLFVHDVALIKDDGSKVSVTLNPREPWQSESLALLDFEDKTGRCSDGTEGLNTAVTGTVAPGSYKGIRFVVGVPEELAHKDQATAPEPLKSAAGLGSTGPNGFRFARLALQQLAAEGMPTGSALFELGSTQCAQGGKCDKPNRSEVQLDAFDVEKNSVVIDMAALFSGLDLTQANDCHASEKSCAPMLDALGIDFATGAPKSGQSLFRAQ